MSSVPGAAICSALLLVLLQIAGAETRVLSAIAVLVGAICVTIVGDAVLKVTGTAETLNRRTTAILVGATATSVALYAAVVLFPYPSAVLLLCAGVLAFLITFPAALRVPRTLSEICAADVSILAVMSLVVGIWCYDVASCGRWLEKTGELYCHSDFYIHGAQLAEFGDALARNRGSIFLADYPRPLYHYGMFQLPAALMSVVPTSGLAIATSVLLPLGLVLGLLGAYEFATELAGRSAGILALAGLTILPDAAQYWLKNGVFSFHWVVFTIPGSGYGIAACFAALMFLAQWCRSHKTGPLIGFALMLLCAFLLRAHFSLLFIPALLISFGLSFLSNRTLLLAGLATAFSVLGLICLAMIEPVRSFWLSHSAVVPYLRFAGLIGTPVVGSGIDVPFVSDPGQAVGVLTGSLLLLPASFGVLVVAYPVALITQLSIKGWRWHVLDTLPLNLVLVLLGVTLFAPSAPWGDVTEYQHRGFVLVYAVLVVWTAAYLIIIIGFGWSKSHSVFGLFAGVAALAVALALWSGFKPEYPPIEFARTSYQRPITAGVLTASRWVRRNAKRGQTIAVGPVDPMHVLVDPATELVSLAGVPSYLALFGMQTTEDDARKVVATYRLRVLHEAENSQDIASVFRKLRSEGISIYVWLGTHGPRFDLDLRGASFRDDDVAIYDLEQSPIR